MREGHEEEEESMAYDFLKHSGDTELFGELVDGSVRKLLQDIDDGNACGAGLAEPAKHFISQTARPCMESTQRSDI